MQCCGSESFGKRDPDPHQSEKPDPDPHQSEKLDPDPHQREKPDPDTLQNCIRYLYVELRRHLNFGK
jgi:hypothetical protein